MFKFLRQIKLPLDPRPPRMMPAHFGRRPLGHATGKYRDVTTVIVSYLTDARQLSEYIPAPFRLAVEPVVTVIYAMNREIDWLAGRAYNLIEVMAPVIFEGRVDRLQGYFALVLWENLCDPILTGRELQGMPKLFADIDDPHIEAGEWQMSAAHFGSKIVDITVRNLIELTPTQIAQQQQSTHGKDHWMGQRYIPPISGQSTELCEPTLFPISQEITQAWSAEGHVAWQTLTWEQNPTQCHIVNALAGLPILEYRSALITKGSTNLYLPLHPPRVLH
jgi:acetoacetate decarboxylase